MRNVALGVLILFGVLMAASGMMSDDGKSVKEVEVCVGTGEKPGMFSDCPTVTKEKIVENDSGSSYFVGGVVLIAVSGVLMFTQDE